MSEWMEIERIRHLPALIKLQDWLDKHPYDYCWNDLRNPFSDDNYCLRKTVSLKIDCLYKKWVKQDDPNSFEVNGREFCGDYHEIFSLGSYYNPQDWNMVLEKTENYLSQGYLKDTDLSGLKYVVQKILASGHPEEYCVSHSF